MVQHRHALNWLRPSQMICGVSVEGREPVKSIRELTCDRCILRLLRTGQALGWSEDDFMIWSLSTMTKLWTQERANSYALVLREGF